LTRHPQGDGRWEEVALTPKEFDILHCLASDPGRVVTRQEILERAWDTHWYGPGPPRCSNVHMAALRRKLGVTGLIETVSGGVSASVKSADPPWPGSATPGRAVRGWAWPLSTG
jgi:DNA-binding response OmpR family regulator